jgi:rubrerythrin
VGFAAVYEPFSGFEFIILSSQVASRPLAADASRSGLIASQSLRHKNIGAKTMTSKMETVGQLFEYAIALERATETLYKQLQNMFAAYPDVAIFWKRYADEENGHAEYLKRTKASVDVNRLSEQADEIMLKKVLHWLEQVSLKRLASVKTLDDAYELAVELENSETNTIFEFMITNFSTNELADSHKFLRTQLSVHVAKLENDFPNPYKSRISRESVLVPQ